MRNHFSLFSLAVLVIAIHLAITPLIAAARDVPIRVEGCPNQLVLSVPTEFSIATTDEQREYRSSVLNGLHQNPGRKARYTEVLFTNWNDGAGLPQILVGALGSTLQSQGRYTKAQWQELKTSVVTSSKAQQEEWTRRGLSRLADGKLADVKHVEGKVLHLRERSANDFTVFGEAIATVAGKPVRLYSAAKFNYAKQCLAYITISVEASDESGFMKLVQFTEQVSVR